MNRVLIRGDAVYYLALCNFERSVEFVSCVAKVMTIIGTRMQESVLGLLVSVVCKSSIDLS